MEASAAYSSLDILGSFVAFWTSRLCALGVILVGWRLLRRLTTVDNTSHCDLLES